MKKIIQKKLYDTEISKEILKISNKLEITNIGYFEETLYKTESGKYFIYGKGGPQSKFGINEGNITFAGSDIWVVNKEDILFWVEYNFKYFSQENIEIILAELKLEISIG
ncbi:hypothetical protein H3C61_01290 [Candidatus Gracilibacteria bacterium]|nr:hypothetical protein [Candidatus Gracilibacteria bacterium]